jgi:hypothetical protein
MPASTQSSTLHWSAAYDMSLDPFATHQQALLDHTRIFLSSTPSYENLKTVIMISCCLLLQLTLTSSVLNICRRPSPPRYTVVRYNTRDALPDVLDDVTCVKLQRELMDWAATHPLMRRLADTRRVYAAGHSRGAKLAALTAAVDPRVAALCLIDPVDVTVYAPLSDRCGPVGLGWLAG